MKKERLSCQSARTISIKTTLNALGFIPKKETSADAWYCSPFRNEKTPSFKVSLSLNRWYDHGEGIGGNIIDLIMKINQCTLNEALAFLSNYTYLSFHQQPISTTKASEKNYTITKVKTLENKALTSYLRSRCIDLDIATRYCQEVYYTCNGKKYFAIAFKNDGGGCEIRNKYFKGCIGTKGVRTISKKHHTKLCLFEGFIDFLSYKTLFKNESLDEDYLIFNSVSLVQKTSFSKQYLHVHAYMDNDEAGRTATNFLKEQYHNLIDCSYFYKQQKDINQYLMENYKA